MIPALPFEIATAIHQAGHRVLVAGGAVRDVLCGEIPKDYDLATSATPDQIISLFPFHDVKLVGKSFGVVFVDGVEVSTFRKDRYFGLSDKNCEITSGTLEDDANRRDFTINAMYMDIFDNFKVIDLVSGMEDLGQCVIKFVGDPYDRIREDPNRIVRAFRFSAKMGFKFDLDTEVALMKYSDYVESYVDPERIKLEVKKALSLPYGGAGIFFKEMQRLGVLKYVFPSLAETEIDGGKHHAESVFDHSILVGNCVSTKFPLVKLAGYLHDVGKPSCRRINPKTGEDWFEGHDSGGAEIAEKELHHLKFSNDEISFVSNLIKMHMRISNGMGPKAVRRLLKDLNEVNISWKDLARLRMADRQGNLKKVDKSLPFAKATIRPFRNELKERPEPPSLKILKVDGNDVMELLGIKPSPEVGRILKELFEKVIDDPSLNERETLIQLMKGDEENED